MPIACDSLVLIRRASLIALGVVRSRIIQGPQFDMLDERVSDRVEWKNNSEHYSSHSTEEKGRAEHNNQISDIVNFFVSNPARMV